ncbi:phosphotransferase [Kineococcus auxinigenes]|uniref:phosphotransferase n=1 Tax=unclassified Kineococcus TaxID=2621656 RepID=UPI003D7EA3F2
MTTATLFDVASVPRQVIATVVLLLAQDGALSLDDPAGARLPRLPGWAEGTHLEHLLHRTGGVPDCTALLTARGHALSGGTTQDDALNTLTSLERPPAPPGSGFACSDSDCVLLAPVGPGLATSPTTETPVPSSGGAGATLARWKTPRRGVDVHGTIHVVSRAERLPPAATEDDLHAVVRDESALRPGVDVLAGNLGLDTGELRRLPNGSLPVYADEHLVLKLFPPVHAAAAPVEAGVLTAVAGRLPVPTPVVRAAGAHDGWRYVLMDRLAGVDLSSVWKDLPRDERRRLAARAGALSRALHQIAPPTIEDWWPQDWPAFLADQRATAVERHHRWGLPQPWLSQVDAFLDQVPLTTRPEVLLHTEVMPANLLATQGASGRWFLSGLCDFEPAMRGSHEYELVAVAVFMAEGDPAVLREGLIAYGFETEQLDDDLSRRLLAWTLLHRFGNAAAFFDLLPAPPRPTLEALATSWFSTASASDRAG